MNRWEKLYPTGLKPPSRPRSALDLWDAVVRAEPAGPCIQTLNGEMSWDEVDRRANSFASALADRGFERGQRVAIFLQNDPEWPITLLGTWKAGGIGVALNPMFKARELAYHLRDSGATAMVALDSLAPMVREVANQTELQHVFLVGHEKVAERSSFEPLSPLLDRTSPSMAVDEPRPEDVALLTYTSGTTGIPKGAMNTHGNIAYNAQLAAQWFDLGSNDAILGVAPLFHITGLVLHMVLSWCARAPLVLLHRFDPTQAIEASVRYNATFTVGSITVFKALLDQGGLDQGTAPLLTKLASGGAPIAEATLSRFESLTGRYIHNVYGLTETTSPSHAVPLGARAPTDPSGAVSVGVPIPGVTARIVDPDTSEVVDTGEYGEILIEGPMVVPGYWNRPEDTAHGIPGGVLHTGDIGYVDQDGWFFVVDRAKDLINAAGYKVWPREVEDLLYQHPDVREAAVIGVPDDYRGETIKAFIATTPASSVTEEELIEFCRKRIAAYKYPRFVEFVDEIPKTPTGKYLRRALRDKED